MPHSTDLRPVAATVYFLPLRLRVPLKFGKETVTRATCARVHLRVRDRLGREAGGIEGTGIGLVITQRLLELMGSQLQVASTEGAGATFSFELRTSDIYQAGQ